MKALIAAEWYKLLRGKVLAIILAGVTVQTLFVQLLMKSADRPPVLGHLGVTVLAETSLFLLVWLLAFVGYFVASEFQSGTMRNILALGKNRIHVYLSKLLFAFIAMTAIFLTVSIVQTAGLSAVYGFGDVPFDEFWRFFTWNFFMQLLYHLMIAAMFTMVAFLSRSLGMTLMLGIGYLIGKMYLPMILGALHIDFAIEYLPDYYIQMFQGMNVHPDFITEGIILSMAYIVITSIIGCIVFKKSDIK